MSLVSVASAGSEGEAAKEIKTGTVTGRIMIKGGGPMAGMQIMFYDSAAGPPPAPEKYDRSPDFTVETDADGRFAVELAPGKYYMAGIKRSSGAKLGHPQEGDYLYRNIDEKGTQEEHLIKSGEKLDLGVLEAVPVTAALRESMFANRPIVTAIKGMVVDADGKPVENAVVVAFHDIIPRERGTPVFVSDRTDKAGNYVLRVTAGTYFLRARSSNASGPPVLGEIIGFYGVDSPAPVIVKTGEVRTGIDLKVRQFIGRGTFPSPTPPE